MGSRAIFCIALLLPMVGCGHGMGKVAQLPDEPMSESQGLAQDGTGTPPPAATTPVVVPTTEAAAQAKILAKYAHLDPGHQVPDSLLTNAVLFFDANQAKISNAAYLSVVDFSRRSTDARFFIINMKSGVVEAIHVAHGSGTDPVGDGWANPKLFSNVEGSNASSLGYYLTAETYSGTHGLSLRLDGLSSTNSNVRARAVVIHGASYVHEASVIQGRSWGCLAVDMALRDEVVGKLKSGSLIYAGLSR